MTSKHDEVQNLTSAKCTLVVTVTTVFWSSVMCLIFLFVYAHCRLISVTIIVCYIHHVSVH